MKSLAFVLAYIPFLTTLVAALNLAVNDVKPGSLSLLTQGGKKYSCKCYPGDSCYPSPAAWSRFNESVQGNLEIALPPGAPCYNKLGTLSTFNATGCAIAQTNYYTSQQWITDHPIASLWSFWTNDTCVPFPSSPSDTCTRGYYGNWVVLAKTKEHIKSTIDFARQNNVRLIIRNSGHDFMGRSTGFGALILNTHSFKTMEFIERYTGPGAYHGRAAVVGAGMQAREMYRIANAQNPPLTIIGGECPTVGFAGGYIQGGGHGPLATVHGMADDNVLSFDVVTAGGDFLTVNELSYPDLFWALRGGGPSTFAAILSVTVRTYVDILASSVILNINTTHTTDPTLFWKGFDIFHSQSNFWVENGMYVYYQLTPLNLHVQPILGPNMTAAQLDAMVKPMFDQLDAAGVPYSTSTKQFDKGFFPLYIDIFEDEVASFGAIVGGRLYTRTDFVQNTTAINAAQRFAAENGALVIGHIVGPGTGVPVADNAVHPKWRDASSFTITMNLINGNASLAEKAAVQNVVTNVIGKKMRDASPNGIAYVSEGDLEEPDWQNAYWGPHYPRLYNIKRLLDPDGVFYAKTTPGTEDWEILDAGTKLCRKLT